MFAGEHLYKIHPRPRTPARPCVGAAHQGRDQDGWRHLPARIGRQGAERSQGAGGGTWWTGQGWKENRHGRQGG